MTSLDDAPAPVSSPLEEKKDAHPNQWILDKLLPHFEECDHRMLRVFYTSPRTPTVLVGKQKHKLPFYNGSWSSKYLDTLAECGRDDPDTIAEAFDVRLDMMFLYFWTSVNLPNVIVGDPDVRIFAGCDLQAPFDVADFYQLDEGIKQWALMYIYVRPMPIARFRLEDKYAWNIISPDGNLCLFVGEENVTLMANPDNTTHDSTYLFEHVFGLDTKEDDRVAFEVIMPKVNCGWNLHISPYACFPHVSGKSLLEYARFLFDEKVEGTAKTIIRRVNAQLRR
jgi:hypothetical protein